MGKLEKWPERDLDELLEEAQKVYVRRDEERMKAKAKIMMAVDNNASSQGNPSAKPSEATQETPRPKKVVCNSCKKEGHGH